MRPPATWVTGPTPRTAASGRCPVWCAASGPGTCCTATSTRTANRSRRCSSATPWCATSSAGTWSTSPPEPRSPSRQAAAVPRDTGFPRADVENDFLRARRRQVLSRLVGRLTREPDDVNMILPFAEVVAAVGFEGERNLGLQTIKVATIVGTVDQHRDFDRRFRPTSARVRERWERLALAQRRGEQIPPIDVYRIGSLHFVRDGHHRVSIAVATGRSTIDAYVTEVLTAVPAKGVTRRSDLVMKSFQRVFLARAPLPAEAQSAIRVRDPWGYAELGEAVEAWGF